MAFHGAMYGSTYGTMSGSVMEAEWDYGGGPLGLLGARPLVAVSSFGDRRTFVPPPDGVWGR